MTSLYVYRHTPASSSAILLHIRVIKIKTSYLIVLIKNELKDYRSQNHQNLLFIHPNIIMFSYNPPQDDSSIL